MPLVKTLACPVNPKVAARTSSGTKNGSTLTTASAANEFLD